MINGSGSGKTNALLNLAFNINNQILIKVVHISAIYSNESMNYLGTEEKKPKN